MENTHLPTIDLLIAGAGLAGLTAANRATELGLKVMVIERQDLSRHLCASRANGGVFHVGFRSVKRSPEELFDVVRSANGNFGSPLVAQALANNALRGVEWLRSHGTEFIGLIPDHGWKDVVLAPVGFHDKTHMAWQGLGADKLIAALEQRLLRGGGLFRREVRAQRLLMDGDRVCGLSVISPAGEVNIHANAVLLADGGFEGSPELIKRHITSHPENLLLRGCESGLGDGIRMAADKGARLLGMESFYGHILSADSLHREGLSPFPFLEFLACSGMLIDDQGDRFVDETAGGHFTSNALARRGSGLGHVVFDHAMWEGIGRHFFCPPNPNLVNSGGTLHQADTLQQLAVLIGIEPDKLAGQAEKINAEVNTRLQSETDAQSREDMPAYAKGKHQHELFAHPPYYAAPACAALTSTLGGVEIDANGRVVTGNGNTIPGLYAAGSVTGGVEGGPEVGYIGGLIKALVFGLLTAEDAAHCVAATEHTAAS